MGRDRSVSFGSLVVDEFELGIGDSPSVSGGVPVALSTKHLGTYTMEVDEFEIQKPKRRPKSYIKLDRDTRMNILLQNGYKEKEIAEAVRTSRNLRHERERSWTNKGWDPVHEVAEKALRKVTKPFRFDSSSKAVWTNHAVQPMTLESALFANRKKQMQQGPEQAPSKMTFN